MLPPRQAKFQDNAEAPGLHRSLCVFCVVSFGDFRFTRLTKMLASTLNLSSQRFSGSILPEALLLEEFLTWGSLQMAAG